MPGKYPVVVFAPNGGATFVVHFNASTRSEQMYTPMPEVRADGWLSDNWRWGGHQIDLQLHTVHFTFVHRRTQECWSADVLYDQKDLMAHSNEVMIER